MKFLCISKETESKKKCFLEKTCPFQAVLSLLGISFSVDFSFSKDSLILKTTDQWQIQIWYFQKHYFAPHRQLQNLRKAAQIVAGAYLFKCVPFYF